MNKIQQIGASTLLWLGLCLTAFAQYNGNHDVGSCTTIAGWAWDSNQPTAPVSVDIYDGNTKLATVEASAEVYFPFSEPEIQLSMHHPSQQRWLFADRDATCRTERPAHKKCRPLNPRFAENYRLLACIGRIRPQRLQAQHK